MTGDSHCVTMTALLPEPNVMSAPDAEHLFRYTSEFSETIISAAHGACIRDRGGREILDFTSGQMSAILGHSHPEIVATVGDAVARLDHLHSSFLSDVVIDFANALSALLPASLSKVLPLSTGGESNEAALHRAWREPQHRAAVECPHLSNRAAADGDPRSDRHRDGHPRPGVDGVREPLSAECGQIADSNRGQVLFARRRMTSRSRRKAVPNGDACDGNIDCLPLRNYSVSTEVAGV